MEPAKTSYYQLNKERILKNMSRKVRCEACDCEVNFNNLPRHNRSPKHLGLLKERMSDDEKEVLIQFEKFLKRRERREAKKQSDAQAPAPASE